ncbi:MAG: hypothetical protein KAQ94_05460 [Arcobacteraceae bacterium]|nr:hypothetical protein [Arcobacteraceae bacterium]
MINNIKLKSILLVLFTTIFTSSYYITKQDKERSINHILKDEIKELKIHYKYVLDNFEQTANIMSKAILKDKKIINIMKRAKYASIEEQAILRDELHTIVQPMGQRLKARGMTNFQFVFPNSHTFLRAHKKNKFGDDLSNIRHSYVYANATLKPINGFEQGKAKHAYRFVYPLFDKQKKHLGAFELSFGSKYIQDILLKSLDIHTHFLVNKEIFEAKIWEKKDQAYNYIKSIEHPQYMFATTSHNSEEKYIKQHKLQLDYLRDKIILNIDLKKEFSLDVIVGDMGYAITFLPIKNIKEKRIVAYLVSYVEQKEIFNIYKSHKQFLIVTFFLLLVIFYFIYKNFLHKQQLKNEVRKQTKEILELNTNLEQKINEEIEKNRKKDYQLIQQSRLAQMGEMISMIAHQWRQPLNAISLTSNNLTFKLLMDDIDKELFKKEIGLIDEYSQHLSKTIDDFRGFFKENKIKEITTLENIVNDTLNIVKISIENKNIKIIKDLNCKEEFKTHPNEVKQVLLNIIKNAEDVLLENRIQNPTITIQTLCKDNNRVLIIRDNGGGISEDIMDKIFDPYYSTKKEKDGTGLGLYMSKTIIEEHCDGKIECQNDENGAVFKIKFKKGKI